MIIAALPLDITVAELADGLQKGGAFERAHTARTLARFGPQAADAVPALVAALDDDSPVVRGGGDHAPWGGSARRRRRRSPRSRALTTLS